MTRISLVLSKQFKGSRFLFVAGRYRRWILIIADQVQQFDAPQLASILQLAQHGLEMVDVETIRLHSYPSSFQAVALNDPKVNEIGGILDQHNVSCIAQRLRGHIKHLL